MKPPVVQRFIVMSLARRSKGHCYVNYCVTTHTDQLPLLWSTNVSLPHVTMHCYTHIPSHAHARTCWHKEETVVIINVIDKNITTIKVIGNIPYHRDEAPLIIHSLITNRTSENCWWRFVKEAFSAKSVGWKSFKFGAITACCHGQKINCTVTT